MNIEEKARAYDAAIERAKELLEIGLKDTRDKRVVLSFFPELRESEGEKIRKALIHLVNSNKELSFGIDNYDGIKWSDILAWLEKQKEPRDYRKLYKNIAESEWFKNAYEDKSLGTDEEQNPIIIKDEMDVCNDLGLTPEEYSKVVHDTIFGEEEQKPISKIEPKFHEGDWVFIEEVKGYKNGPFQIKTVDSFGYSFDEYHTIPFMYEDILSKWTIQDAKDGDVLMKFRTP